MWEDSIFKLRNYLEGLLSGSKLSNRLKFNDYGSDKKTRFSRNERSCDRCEEQDHRSKRMELAHKFDEHELIRKSYKKNEEKKLYKPKKQEKVWSKGKSWEN